MNFWKRPNKFSISNLTLGSAIKSSVNPFAAPRNRLIHPRLLLDRVKWGQPEVKCCFFVPTSRLAGDHNDNNNTLNVSL